jgi:hypothetical protein
MKTTKFLKSGGGAPAERTPARPKRRKRRPTDHEIHRQGRPNLAEAAVLCGRSGCYPWDDWEAVARGEGVDEAAAALGRAVIRAAWVYDWPEPLRGRCGWRDNGRAMRRWARLRPRAAALRWLAYLQNETA